MYVTTTIQPKRSTISATNKIISGNITIRINNQNELNDRFPRTHLKLLCTEIQTRTHAPKFIYAARK